MFRHSKTTSLVLALLACLLPPAPAAETNDAAALILELGASSHKERTSAAEALWQIGPPARNALQRAAASDDPEIRLAARELLRSIDYGIRPSWPEGLRRQARRYNALSSQDREAFMGQLVQTVQEGAIPFLLMRVEKGEKGDAESAIKLLKGMADPDAMWTAVIGRVQKPVNAYQARLLALACEAIGSLHEIANVLGTPHLEKSERSRLVKASVERLQAALARSEYARVEKIAAAFSQSVPDDARFVYLQAIATAERGQVHRAAALEQEALALNADDESPHYTVGEMLRAMGHSRLSEREWLKILDIPPDGDVYDINAHLRLATIHATAHKHAQAADAYEAVVTLYAAARQKGGSGYGIVGTNEEGLTKMAENQRRYAAGGCPKQAAHGNDAAPDGQVEISLDISVKHGELADLHESLAAAAMTMSVNVQPRSVRLFRDAKARLAYDLAKQEFNILLNNSPCTKSRPYKLSQEKTKVAVNTLDMSYIYEVDRLTGTTTQTATFEKDYTLRIEPSPEILAWSETTITANAETYTWESLQKGIALDYLPEAFDLHIEGLDATGKRQSIHQKLDPARLETSGR